MTLHLVLTNRDGTVHVGDRKLTFSGGRQFDDASNKIVIFRARDAMVSIGFTGIAYLNGMPTDEWIARRLVPEAYSDSASASAVGSINTGSGPAPAVTLLLCPRKGVQSYWPNLPLALRRLQSALNEWLQLARQPDREQALTVVATGVRLVWESRRAAKMHPCAALVSKGLGGSQFTFEWTRPRDFYLGGAHSPKLFSYPAEVFGKQERAALMNRLRASLRPGEPINCDIVERVLVNTIQDVALRTPYVGDACVSVTRIGVSLRTRYFELDKVTGSLEQPMNRGFTPTVLMPTLRKPAGETTGGWRLPTGLGSEMLEDVLSEDGRKISELTLRAQPRKSWP